MLVKLTGKTVDVMCGVSKYYEEFAGVKNGKRVLYLRLQRVVMGACNPQYCGMTPLRGVLRIWASRQISMIDVS